MGTSFGAYYQFFNLKKEELTFIENQLKLRLKYPYRWYRKQNDQWDQQSNFIYSINNWNDLLVRIRLVLANNTFHEKEFLHYTINRWYNFWSAKAVESIFVSHQEVIPNKNTKSKYVDFYIKNIPFDLKTTVFPKRFNQNVNQVLTNPEKLIRWLYQHQSKGGRMHFENRLFLVLHANSGEHWKLKAEIKWLEGIISSYVTTFDSSKLTSMELVKGKITIADLIWASK